MPKHGPRQTMHAHVSDYLNRVSAHVARSTLKNKRTTLVRFATWWDSTRKVPKNLLEQDVRRYVWGRHECQAECRGRVHRGPGLRHTYSDSALNQELSHLHEFLGWGVRYGYLRPEVTEPVTVLERVRVRRTRRRRLTIDQLEKLIDGCDDPWERVVVALAIYTAGRAGELNTLRVADVDLEVGEIQWTRHKTRQDDDYLPITADLRDELERWFKCYEEECGSLRGDWYLIPHRCWAGRPGRLTYKPELPRARGSWVVVKKHLCRVLGVNADELLGEGVHTVRRSIARCLYERLCDERHPDPISVVQALLGHLNRGMTERYIGVETGRRERDKVLRGKQMLTRRG